ncbi:peptidase domain-containing protein [Candidatus Methanoperedens nitratireducens]|uniref:Peptidase domain protein n=1 Tax=Candidatus Methanoperedens nitratireducens TaxID=1392998 RepID=A0A284VK50_9EURY|nr:peptidase domain-containing protein [Candidatus Methanoperedens nitroreducens]SNQ59633.1 conserved exported hypothetical protein [Candidatus Methanoperedens nitroreducens]
MHKKIGIAIALLLFSASLAMAAASEEKMNATNGGYTEGATTGTEGGAGIQTVYATITQGQTNWHTKEVKDFITTLNVDLNWGNSGNSLRLKIYSPDGYVFGPYFDIDDGSINGRINRYINNPNGIAKGTWYYEVYGYSVSGTEDYYI